MADLLVISPMYAWHPPRTLSGAASAAIVGAMFALLVLGLNVQRTAEAAFRLVSVDLNEPPPKPQPTEQPKAPKPHVRKPAPKHEASPRNVRNKATAVVAPQVTPLKPPPVLAAAHAGPGSAANNGASNRPGPGQGAGGVGNGLGGGGLGGNGDGDGGWETPPREISTNLSLSDLPQGIFDNDAPGISMEVLFTVLPNGTAANCRISQSSGYSNIDVQICRNVEKRFRLRPALDAHGRPVRSQMVKSLYFGPR